MRFQDVDSAAPKSADYSLINIFIVSYFYSLVKNYAGFYFDSLPKAPKQIDDL